MMFQSVLTYSSHQVLKAWCDQQDKVFQKNLGNLEQVQRAKLDKILKSSTFAQQKKVRNYDDFKANFPVSRYQDWKHAILASRHGQQPLSSSRLVRYQPTSGSSEQIKFIPYNKMFLDELDHAIAAWLASIYRKCPELIYGTHYWSVSWLPESQREVLKDDNLNDDSALLSSGKRLLSKFTQAVSGDVSFAAQADDAIFATLCYLVADQNLAMISVWSPTFAIQLIENLEKYRREIVQVLEVGHWGERAVSLQTMKAPHSKPRAIQLIRSTEKGQLNLKKLWPRLKFVSSWDTAGSQQWASVLQARIPFAQFEGKGLWATEGVVTIPYDDHYPLAYQSHFYEFEYLSGDQCGEVIPSWHLKQGDLVSPIITSGNGLLRYSLDDCLLVTGFMQNVPCFEFQGRRFGVDLVGEKLAPETAMQLLSYFNQPDFKAVSLLAVDTGQSEKPYYSVLFEGQKPDSFQAEAIDQLLRRNFHYDLARDLGQLETAQFHCVEDGWQAYKTLVMQDGMIEGNIKPEPLKKICSDSLKLLV